VPVGLEFDHRKMLIFVGISWDSLGCPGIHWNLLEFIGIHWDFLGLNRLV
jgi:hypothetical protein